ncbi:MAG: CHASE2 domain-containing protein [Chitinispirillales bacterium]|jgi:adenylate cyclase|nr:CHASE2 domain-containing protein [Chitinispirillales bacterium]
MKMLKKFSVILTLSLLFSTGAVFLLDRVSVRFVNRIENVTYDWRYRLRYQGTGDMEFPDYGIYIVDIDERSMEKLGSYWGWDRGYQARMVDALSRRFPAAIVFDVLFYGREDEIRYRRFAQVLNDAISGDSVLFAHSDALNERLALAVNYDVQFEEAIARSGRVTLGVSLDDVENYRGVVSQIAHRMDMDWHNSLNPASTLVFPDSLLARIRQRKSIIDGIYPENARAARDIGHLNVIDGVVRSMPLFYRFGDFSPLYLPVSIRVAATLFGTPNDEIVFRPGQYIDIGKPFKIFKDSVGRPSFSYPDFTEAQFRMLMAAAGNIAELEEEQRFDVSSYTAIYRDSGGQAALETRTGKLSHQLTMQLLRGNIWELDNMGIDDEKELGGGYTVLRDSETDWEIFSGSENFWLTALDIKTFAALAPEELEFELGEDGNRKLLTFDFWVRREGGVLVSALPVLRGATLDELLGGGPKILEYIPHGGRRDFGRPAKIPLRRGNRHIITYFGPRTKPFPYFSFYDIMENNVNEMMEGKIFIVGSASPALFDIKSAPHDRDFPAVEIHASLLNSIFTDTYVRRLADQHHLLLLIIIGFIAALVGFLTKPLLGILIAAGLIFAYSVAAFRVFNLLLIWIEMVRPIIAITLTFTTVMVYRYVTEERNRKFLQSTFKQYLSPELIDMMYTQKQKPKLGGDEGTHTAFFTDIEGFSTFSEKLGSPTKLVELLNEYLTAMTDILLSHRGTLDKYVGDAIIAFYGAPMYTPDHAAQACRTALDMQRKLGELRGKWRGEGDKWPEIVHCMRMRIGINTGAITTGNMGSAMRMNYTMMGDSVNLAARLESAAKHYGVSTMISGYTYDMIKDSFETRKLDVITVVGKSEPVAIYELLGQKNELTEEVSAMLKIYNEGIDHYYNRNWGDALSCFVESGGMEPNKKTAPEKPTPSKRFEDMCKRYIDNPPGADWDGVNRLTSK